MEVAQVGTGKLAVSTLIKRDMAATGHMLLSFTVCFVCSFNSKWMKISLIISHMFSQEQRNMPHIDLFLKMRLLFSTKFLNIIQLLQAFADT